MPTLWQPIKKWDDSAKMPYKEKALQSTSIITCTYVQTYCTNKVQFEINMWEQKYWYFVKREYAKIGLNSLVDYFCHTFCRDSSWTFPSTRRISLHVHNQHMKRTQRKGGFEKLFQHYKAQHCFPCNLCGIVSVSEAARKSHIDIVHE